MAKETMMRDPAMIAKIYEVMEIEDYFQNFEV